MVIQRRKLQRIGRSSYGITLPKKWIDEVGLKAGEYLDLYVDPSSISICAYKESDKRMKISIDEYSEQDLKRLVVACYIAGYTEMEFETQKEMFFPSNKEKAIRDIRTRLPAMDFVAADSVTSIRLRASEFPLRIQQNLEEIQSELKKMYEVVFQMFGFKDTKKIVQAVNRLELGVDSHSYIAKRLIMQVASDKSIESQQGLDTPLAVMYYSLISSLESSGDLLQSICHKTDSIYSIKGNDKVTLGNLERISAIIKKIYECYLDLFKAFEKKDLDSINSVADVVQYELKLEIDSMTELFPRSLPSVQLSLLWAISSELKWLNRCVWDIADVIIDILVIG